MFSRKHLLSAILFGSVIILYLVSILLTFQPRSGGVGIGDVIAFALTLIAGLLIFGLGYVSVIGLGGMASLGLIELSSRFNGSKHALEIKNQNEATTRQLKNYLPLFYMPAIILLIALAIAVNIHYLDSTFAVTFQSLPSPIIQGILSGLDIFLKPTSVGSLRYSIEIIPIMGFFIGIAGIIPSIVLPYLRKFRINSLNGVPFDKGILYSAIGAVFGLTIILSIVNIIYGVIIGTQPHYYSYVLPTLVGFSLHYFLGAYFGRDKAERLIEQKLHSECREHIFEGTITLQEK